MQLKEFRRKLKEKMLYTAVQSKVRYVTRNHVTFPSDEELDEIALLTYDPVQFEEVMRTLFKRLNDTKNWRHVFKGLNLMEHLLRNGHLKVVEKCGENIYFICMLQTYKFVEGKADWGSLIRDHAETIFELLHEPELLATEREIAALKRAKESTAEEQLTPTKVCDKTYPITSTPTLSLAQKLKIAEQENVEDSGLDKEPDCSLIPSFGRIPLKKTSDFQPPEQFEKNDSPVVNANTMKQKTPAIASNDLKMFGAF